MISSIFFVSRLTFAWLAVYMALSLTLHETFFRHTDGGFIVLFGFLLAGFTIIKRVFPRAPGAPDRRRTQ